MIKKAMEKTIEKIIGLIILLIVLSVPSASAMDVPFACFADGEVFNSDGSAVNPGVNVVITNLETGETIKTTTGYPNYPPVEQYDNDYKSVFVCRSGYDRVSIKAWNKTHYGYEELLVPKGSQALMNITLDNELTSKKTMLGYIKKMINYFLGKKKD